MKKYKSIIRKNKRKHDKIVFLPKAKENHLDVLLSKGLIDSNIRHDEFALIKNALKEYVNMKEEIKNQKDLNS